VSALKVELSTQCANLGLQCLDLLLELRFVLRKSAARADPSRSSTLNWVLLPLNIVVLVGFLFLMLRDIWKPAA
jgi:hypothetical protein